MATRLASITAAPTSAETVEQEEAELSFDERLCISNERIVALLELICQKIIPEAGETLDLDGEIGDV